MDHSFISSKNASAVVRVFGLPTSTKAFGIRDFLNRSVVEYEWIELPTDEDARALLDIESFHEARLPICEFPDGTRLFNPSIREVAERLGWVTKPKYLEYDLSIYGAGPAGLSAAVYAASEGLRTVLIERNAIGGQAGSSSLIENYMGFPDGISGARLAERARQQAVKFGAEILHLREGVNAEFRDGGIQVDLADGTRMMAKANICATGIEYRRLELPNESRFLGAGVFYGAGASEAPLCVNQTVYVIGGGNSAGQAAIHFSHYADKVVMLVRGASLAETLSHYLIKKIEISSNISVVTNCEITGLNGEETLQKITVQDRRDGTTEELDAHWVFVCIGGSPNTEWAKDTPIIRDKAGYLVTGADLCEDGHPPAVWPLERAPFFLETSVPGSFAAGDVRHGSVKRVASGVGEGAMAVTFVHRYLAEL
jgi:thioredoxin reductase (NADPH)